MTLCLHCCRVYGESIYFAIMQMLAWLPVAIISPRPWPMSRRADAIVASSARVMVFVAPEPLGLKGDMVSPKWDVQRKTYTTFSIQGQLMSDLAYHGALLFAYKLKQVSLQGTHYSATCDK